MEFSLFHLHEVRWAAGKKEGWRGAPAGRKRRKKRRKDATEGEERAGGEEGGVCGGQATFLSDGSLRSPREWRDETGRKTRGERERERREKWRM